MKNFLTAFIVVAMLVSCKKEAANINLASVIDQEIPMLSVQNNNYVILKNKAGKQLFKNCYEVDFIEIRKQSGNYLPLTFISGKKAVDADFYSTNDKWIATRVTYFDPGVNNGKGKTLDFKVSLSNFDFNTIVEKALEN